VCDILGVVASPSHLISSPSYRICESGGRGFGGLGFVAALPFQVPTVGHYLRDWGERDPKPAERDRERQPQTNAAVGPSGFPGTKDKPCLRPRAGAGHTRERFFMSHGPPRALILRKCSVKAVLNLHAACRIDGMDSDLIWKGRQAAHRPARQSTAKYAWRHGRQGRCGTAVLSAWV
jgi:hypothetical protein